jgi:hypothetical protein
MMNAAAAPGGCHGGWGCPDLRYSISMERNAIIQR